MDFEPPDKLRDVTLGELQVAVSGRGVRSAGEPWVHQVELATTPFAEDVM